MLALWQHRHRHQVVLLLWQVATRRTRTAGKVEIPNVDDHVSKLEHMGKETVKKLQDIKGAAIQAGVDINIPENCINKGALTAHQDLCRGAAPLSVCDGLWPCLTGPTNGLLGAYTQQQRRLQESPGTGWSLTGAPHCLCCSAMEWMPLA